MGKSKFDPSALFGLLQAIREARRIPRVAAARNFYREKGR